MGGWDVDDDWELDAWEDEAFDEDVYDYSDAELEADDLGVEDEEEQFASHGLVAVSTNDANLVEVAADGGTAPGLEVRDRSQGDGVGWSAWEVGTIFALGGWLADHHAEEAARRIAEALEEHGRSRPSGRAIGATRVAPPSGHSYVGATGQVEVGGSAEPRLLAADLATADERDRGLMVQLEAGGKGRTLLMILSVVTWSSGPRLWVVAEEHSGGFMASRLLPVFQRAEGGGAAVFATDHVAEAVDAALWAAGREGLSLADFRVAIRRSEAP